MPNLGIGELFLIFMMLLLVFGWKRLPQLGEGMGKAISNFKRGLASNDDIEVRSSPAESKQIEDRSASRVSDAEVSETKKHG